MSRRTSESIENRDRAAPLRETADRERRDEDEESRPRPQREDGGSPSGRTSEQGDKAASMGRPPSPEPDVFLDVPEVKVDEIYLNVENLQAHLSLRSRLANLVQLVAGVHVELGKVELDIKGVEAEALLKIRLENLYNILDRALTTIDRNPRVLEALLATADSAIDDVGETAKQAVGPGGAGSKAVEKAGESAKQALGPGGAGSKAVDQVGDTAEEALDEVGDTADEALDEVGDAAEEAVGELDDTAEEAVDEAPRRTGQRRRQEPDRRR